MYYKVSSMKKDSHFTEISSISLHLLITMKHREPGADKPRGPVWLVPKNTLIKTSKQEKGSERLRCNDLGGGTTTLWKDGSLNTEQE